MLTSLSLIFLVGLAMGAICQSLKLPKIIGMLVTGIVLGPYVLDWLDPSILSISAELRKMALIIILLKAGLSLNLADLKKVGRPAVLMSFLPASFEILGYVLLAPVLLGITRVEAAVMGAVLGAVSPAVVVPRMVSLMEQKYGTKKAIPQMILAGASCDDIFASPERMATLSFQRVCTAGLPRRMSERSMMSSCSSVKLWNTSTAAAAGRAPGASSAKSPAASSSSRGRIR